MPEKASSPAQQNRKTGAMYFLRSSYARRFFSRYKWSYILGSLILIATDVVQVRVPVIVGSVIDGVADRSITSGDFNKALIAMALIALVVMFGRVGWRYCIFGSARKIERDMRDDLFSHLLTLPKSYFHEHKAGEIMAFMTNDIEAIRLTYAITIMMGMDTLVIGVMVVISMVTEIDLTLSVVAILPLMMVALVSRFMGNEIHKRFTIRQEAFAKVSDFVQERLSGIKVIKSFVREEQECRAFYEVNSESKRANIRETRIEAIMFPFMRMITGISIAIAVGYGGLIAIRGRITVGDLAAFVQYLNMLVWPIAAIGRTINVVTRGSASLARIEDVLATESDIKDPEPEAAEPGAATEAGHVSAAEHAGTQAPEHLEGSIEVSHLTFRYPGTDTDVLKDICFRVERGQTLGIVGRTGAGKTTLVDLMMRAFDSEPGAIKIGGKNIQDVSLETLRSTIGYVPQDDFLFSASVSDNIRFGDRSKTQEEIEEAARLACVHDNITDFKDGYDTMVGERGVSLSGGQKQRIAIARALILDPEILILDDSLSAVDTDTEAQIKSNLAEKRAGRTNVLIAHRLSTLQDADLIIVIEDGRITESGTHDELLSRGGFYAELWQRQLMEKMRKEELGL